MKEMNCLLAAAFHPHFKLAWLHPREEDLKQTVKQKMISLLDMRALDENSSPSEEEFEKDDFFGSLYIHKEKKSTSRDLVECFLHDKPQKKKLNDAFPNSQFRDMFIRYNTAIPSSAAVERIFSIGKDIFKPKRSGLSDEHFEMLVFLKGLHV